MEMDRRGVLTGLAASSVLPLAGCTGDSTSADDGGGEPTPDEMSETPVGASARPQHDLGDPFTVGTGVRSIRYVVETVSVAERIGTESFTTTADGLFLVVGLTMENVGDESIDITSRHLQVVDSQGRTFDADDEATTYLSQDARFGTEGITFEQLQPGLRQTRAVAFDIVSEESYAFKVSPAGIFSDAVPHYVALGTVPEP
ncbi:DUF4352 domain-containing protein [Haloplanus halobius]|uniref:DUF4352 domain-containing protein n=1 Tax=Haloplanus halobius TaxID=2934938 RepID=UPI00200DA638|nr:DUF4352 domain-containing protein [Haloplanus sp. XH21]